MGVTTAATAQTLQTQLTPIVSNPAEIITVSNYSMLTSAADQLVLNACYGVFLSTTGGTTTAGPQGVVGSTQLGGASTAAAGGGPVPTTTTAGPTTGGGAI